MLGHSGARLDLHEGDCVRFLGQGWEESGGREGVTV